MKKRPGQVGLLLLVIMAVVVAVVMAVASRSLSDTVLSRQEKEGNLAFGLAETGVENALKTLREGTVPTGTVGLADSTGLVTGNYEVETSTGLNLYLREGEVGEIDLTGVPGGSLVLFRWTKRNDPSEDITTCIEGSGTMPAAMELNVYMSNGTVARVYINPSNCTPSNNFSTAGDGGSNFRSQRNYMLPANPTKIRFRPLYMHATVQVTGANLTEDQMYVIKSSATGGDAQKEIEVRRGLDAPASIFDYAVFSGQTIVK